MSAYGELAGEPDPVAGAGWMLQVLAGGVDVDHRVLHDRVSTHSAGWLSAAANTAADYLQVLRVAAGERPAELAAVSVTLRDYAEALRTAQDAVRALNDTHARTRADAATLLGHIEANVAPDEIAATSARVLADRDADLAGLGTAYEQVLADLDLAAATAAAALHNIGRAAGVAAAALVPDGLIAPQDPVAAGQLLATLVGRELTAHTAMLWQQLAGLLEQRLDDPVFLGAFFAAAGPAVLAVPGHVGQSRPDWTEQVLGALGDGLLSLQAAEGTAGLPPAIRAALDDRELSLTWSTGLLPGTAGTPMPAQTVQFATVTGAEDFVSFLALVSAASGSHADPAFVALLATQTMMLARDPVFTEIAARRSTADVHARGTTVPTNGVLGLTARTPGAPGSLVADSEGRQELLRYGQNPGGGDAVGGVFRALTDPVDPDSPDAAAITRLNRVAQAALIHELATNAQAHADLSEGARDGLVTMTIRLFPDLTERFADPVVTRAEGAALRVSHADLAGHLRFLTADAQDSQDLMVATQVWTQLRLAEILAPGSGYELPVEIPLITADGGWLLGVIIDARTDVLADGELDRQAAELDVLVEQMLADTVVADIGQLIGATGDGLQFFSTPPVRAAGTAALLVSDAISIFASTPRPDTDALRARVDGGEVEDQLTSNAITGYRQLFAAAALESGRFGLPEGFVVTPGLPMGVGTIDPGTGDVAPVALTTLSVADTEALQRWLVELGLITDGTLSDALTQGLGAG